MHGSRARDAAEAIARPVSGWGADYLPAFFVTTFAGELRDRGTRATSIGGKYLEDCAVAPVDDTPNPFADGVRSYALDADKAKHLWAKSEALVGAG